MLKFLILSWPILAACTVLVVLLALSFSSTPKILWEKSSLDLGTIKKGATLSQEFYFTNNGDSNLKIFAADTYPSDIKAQIPERDLNPGERGKISLSGPVNAESNFNIAVKISSNAGNNELKILGRVEKT